MPAYRPAAFLWDMDGTIIDTEPAWMRAEEELLHAWGSSLLPEDALDWVGIGLPDLARIFQERGVQLPATEIIATLSARVDEEIFSGDLAWRPGAPELLEALTRDGHTNVLVTMATRAQAESIIAHLPEGTFADLVTGTDVARPKPHPEAYLRGAELIGAQASECIAFEDSMTGATAAYRSGAFVVGVPHLVELTTPPCDLIIDGLHDVTPEALIHKFHDKRERALCPTPHTQESKIWE